MNNLLIHSAVMNMSIESSFSSTRNAAGTFCLGAPEAPPATCWLLPEGSAGSHSVRAHLDFLDTEEGLFSACSAILKAQDVGSSARFQMKALSAFKSHPGYICLGCCCCYEVGDMI